MCYCRAVLYDDLAAANAKSSLVWHRFVKIMMLNPRDCSKAAGLLQAGGILGRRFQPYEAHIPYLLQLKVLARRLLVPMQLACAAYVVSVDLRAWGSSPCHHPWHKANMLRSVW